ncbi:MAG TPA: hypothetical protein VGM82_24350 [Gemmatimonadaceae bacterium]
MRTRTSMLLLGALLGACSGDTPTALGAGKFCPAVLSVRLSPQDTTLNAGERFHPTMTIEYCGDSQSETPILESNEERVATVDPLFGNVIARGTGATEIKVSSKRYGTVSEIAVTVR